MLGTVDVREYDDGIWKGCLPAASVTELLADHAWMTYVAGVLHFEGAAAWAAPGSQIRLVREPDNPKDINAVSVWTDDGLRAGYLPRRIAADIDSTVDRYAVVLAEMRIEERRVGMWILVSREHFELRTVREDGGSLSKLLHNVDHLKERALSALDHAHETQDPVEAMRIMADALDHSPGVSHGTDLPRAQR